MKVFTNTTSPYARIARIALIEKGYDVADTDVVNPWADDPGLNAANSAARVPAVVLDSGLPLTESLLIVVWLEKTKPTPSLLSGDIEKVVSQAGKAMGVIDASAQIVTGRMQWDPNFGEHKVGLKRRRTILAGFDALEAQPPVYDGDTPSLAVLTTVVALDYAKLRFKDDGWLKSWPGLEALRGQVAEREAFKSTEPYVA